MSSKLALVGALNELPCQTIVTTHSSNLLDRVDPRRVVRVFRRRDGSIDTACPRSLSDEEARTFARFSTPQTAEAFFAHVAVLVEGESDKFALEAVAQKIGRNLDGESVSIVSLEGAGGLSTYLGMLGAGGFNLKVCGLCDADHEAQWAKKLEEAGFGSNLDRAGMEALGFFVCDLDLEDELIRQMGTTRVLELIRESGDESAFEVFKRQPTQQGASTQEQLRAFFGKRGRKVRYAPMLVDCLANDEIPACLLGVLESAR